MRFLHSRLDRFSEIEVRTNLSFPHKQKPVLALDWKGKLHYHIACHIYDKNFRPWDFVDILQSTDSLDYVLKFVATKTNQTYVDSFIEFFVKQGISEDKIVIIHDIRDTDGETEIPKSYPWLQKWFENPVKLTPENLSNPFVEQSVTT